MTPADTGPPAFVPVRIVDETKNAPLQPADKARPAVRGAAISITLPNGARIEIGVDAGEAALRLALSVAKSF